MTPLELNQRKFPRRKLGKPIGILYRGNYALVHGLDLSEGGLSFESAEALPDGAFVVVSVQIPASTFMITRAVIQSIREGSTSPVIGYGVSFPELAVHHRRAIREFIARKSHQEIS